MSLPPAAANPSPMERDLASLEAKLATLITHTRALRAANETLRRDLAASYEKNRSLVERVTAATERLDALLAELPEAAQ